MLQGAYTTTQALTPSNQIAQDCSVLLTLPVNLNAMLLPLNIDRNVEYLKA